MSSTNLDNLVKIGSLKQEPFDQSEFDGLINLGRARIKDANLNGLSHESRFDLAYNAAHSLALAACIWLPNQDIEHYTFNNRVFKIFSEADPLVSIGLLTSCRFVQQSPYMSDHP